MDVSGRRIALALGGGGARGCAHIGAIEELQRRGADIVAISGTSMGAIIGGIHAVGRLADYKEWLVSLSQRDVLRLLDPALRAPGMINGEKVMQRIRELIDDVRIEDLPVPYTAVATDLLTGKEVWFQTGPLDHAMRASIAIPSVFTPLVDSGRVLVDGGLLNNLPVSPLASAHFDLLVVIDLLGPSHKAAQAQPDQHDPGLSTLDVMELSIQVMQRLITRYQIANYPADVFVQLPADMCGTMEFHRAAEVIELGRQAMSDALDV